ncbi:MAG: response regulator [Gammaproteobacteria bacterium]|nr:response regulator [Gammaproteobacteria bacterium]
MSKLSILLIEDNQLIAQQLCEFLEGHNWNVDYADNGRFGTSLALENEYDVILLDLNLPDVDGLSVCREIKDKAQTNTPILMLTARDAFEDKARGFGEGADDYVTKPFELRELELRCQALARRQQLHLGQSISVGDLVIEKRQHQAHRQGQPLKLTGIGFSILTMLAEAYPQPVSRSSLIHALWGDEPPDTDALRSHIYSLRQTLDKPYEKAMLKTITNVGFKLDAD